MSSFSRSRFVRLTGSNLGVILDIVAPALGGMPESIANILNPDDSVTDASIIVSTVAIVEQKGGADDSTPPNKPVSDTVVTAIDGRLVSSDDQNQTLARRGAGMWEKGKYAARNRIDYTQIFAGTGTAPSDRDAAIEGTAYLTYTLVPNATYNVDACLDYCDVTEYCGTSCSDFDLVRKLIPVKVFVNLYYEFNNELLDHVFSEDSNLKCVAYAEIHTADEKTNWGGQQSLPPPAPVTYIQQSSGYALTSLVNPPTPDGYELVFGPTDGANIAPGVSSACISRRDTTHLKISVHGLRVSRQVRRWRVCPAVQYTLPGSCWRCLYILQYLACSY